MATKTTIRMADVVRELEAGNWTGDREVTVSGVPVFVLQAPASDGGVLADTIRAIRGDCEDGAVIGYAVRRLDGYEVTRG